MFCDLRLAICAAFSFAICYSSLGQGALTPPGAPAATMKTLTQIEPRTPISSAPYPISQPGSYYLTTNVSVSTGDAITIVTNGVTLDLNGFTISSTATGPSGTGIMLDSSLRNITIANGFVQGGVTNNGSGTYSGSGFGYGIYFDGNPPVNVRVSGVSVSGCLNYGIYLDNGDSTLVENCTVRTVGQYGIYASTIKASLATDCGNHAIFGDLASDCRGQCSGVGDGIQAGTTLNCYGQNNGSSDGSGVDAANVQNCYGVSSNGFGVIGYTVQNSFGSSGSGTGIFGYTVQNCYGNGGSDGVVADTAENCYGYGSSYGIYANETAIGCFGSSPSGTGLVAESASTCTGSSSSNATAIQATIANGCYAASGTNNITFKYNMP